LYGLLTADPATPPEERMLAARKLIEEVDSNETVKVRKTRSTVAACCSVGPITFVRGPYMASGPASRTIVQNIRYEVAFILS
jgi:hypothetical protein